MLGADGIGTKPRVGGSLSNDQIVGITTDKIAVRPPTECDMPSWFGFVDPAAGDSSIVLQDSRTHRGPGAALGFPRG